MVHYYLDGKHDVALNIQLSLLPLNNAIFSEVNPIPIKAAMNLLGLDVGAPRLPLIEMTGSALEKLKISLLAYGFELGK